MGRLELFMAINYQSIVADGLPKQIAHSIREAIMSGRLAIDERLPSEEELATQFGVSRPTIREALKRLAAQNLIRSQRGPAGGTFVTKPSFDEACESIHTHTTCLASIGQFELGEIAEGRAEFEKMCCDLAVKNRTDEILTAMRDEIDRQEHGQLNDEDFCRSDVTFHRNLALATQNQVLIFAMRSIFEALHPAANMTAVRHQSRELIIGFHKRLLQALIDRNLAAARDVIDEQMNYHSETFKAAQAEWQRRKGASEQAL